MDEPAPVNQRLEVVGQQNTLFGKPIALTQFKNLEEKRALKEKVKAMFDGDMIRSILTPKDIDGNKRLDKIERREEKNSDSVESTMARADAFGKKTMETLSTFPEIITSCYVALLSNPNDKVYDAFMGHNSRATACLSMGRKYYSYDVHTFPVEFTKKSCEIFNATDYELNLGSSEKVKYADASTGIPVKLLKLAKERGCDGYYGNGQINYKKVKPAFERMLDDLSNLIDDDISFWKKENAKLDAELKVLQKKKLERNTFDAEEIKQLLIELAAKVSVVINAAVDEIPAPSAGKSDVDIKIICDAAKKKIFTMLEREMSKTVK